MVLWRVAKSIVLCCIGKFRVVSRTGKVLVVCSTGRFLVVCRMSKVMVVADRLGSDEDVSCRFLRNNTRPASSSCEFR
jgi:hypothetical protein